MGRQPDLPSDPADAEAAQFIETNDNLVRIQITVAWPAGSPQAMAAMGQSARWSVASADG